MRFTVTMKCAKCGEKFVGQDEHLVDAVTHMVESAAAGNHDGKHLNQELQALAQKAKEVNVVGSILDVLGLEPGQVMMVDIVKPPEKEEPDETA
jgi:hypothetical protein